MEAPDQEKNRSDDEKSPGTEPEAEVERLKEELRH